jgi:hypothetical protein
MVVIAVILNYFHNRAKYYQTLFNELFNIDDLLKYFQYFDPSIRSNYFKIRNSILIKSAKNEDMIKKLDKNNNQGPGNSGTVGGGTNTQQSRHSSYKIKHINNQQSIKKKNTKNSKKRKSSSSSEETSKANQNPTIIKDNYKSSFNNSNSKTVAHHHPSTEIYAKNNALKKHYNTIKNNTIQQTNNNTFMNRDNANLNASNSKNALVANNLKNQNVLNMLNNNLVKKNKTMNQDNEIINKNKENYDINNENPITSFINLVETTRNEKKTQADKRHSYNIKNKVNDLSIDIKKEKLNSNINVLNFKSKNEENIIPEAFNENDLNNINQSDKVSSSINKPELITKNKADAYLINESSNKNDEQVLKELEKLSEEDLKILKLKQNLQNNQGIKALNTCSSNDDNDQGKLLKENSDEEKSSDNESEESGGSLYLREKIRQEEEEAKNFYMDTLKKDDKVRDFFYKIRNDRFELTTWELFRFFCCGKDTDLVRKKNILFGGKELIEERMDVCQLMKKMLEFDRFKNLMLDSNQLLLLDSLSKFMLDPERAKLIDIKDCQFEKFIDNFSTVYKRDNPIDIILSNWVKKKYHFE